MYQVQLQYGTGGGTKTMNFNVFSATVEDVEYLNVTHKLLNGGYVQDQIGYRFITEIEFAPIENDLTTLRWLQAFTFDKNRVVTLTDFGGGVRNVSLKQDALQYDFYNGVSFADGFKMSFVEQGFRTVSDDASTRILKPTYQLNATALVGGTLTLSVDLCDNETIEIHKSPLEYMDRSVDDIGFGFLHHFTIDTGVIHSSTHRNWIRDFALWGSSQIDTSAVDHAGGDVYTVISDFKQLKWKFVNGSWQALSATLSFLETGLRTAAETHTGGVFILDKSKLDTQVLG